MVGLNGMKTLVRLKEHWYQCLITVLLHLSNPTYTATVKLLGPINMERQVTVINGLHVTKATTTGVPMGPQERF
jgi:hypothetical protein